MSILRWLFGCTHANYSWPMSVNRGPIHVCCLECGREVRYDWNRMRPLWNEPVKACERQEVFEVAE